MKFTHNWLKEAYNKRPFIILPIKQAIALSSPTHKFVSRTASLVFMKLNMATARRTLLALFLAVAAAAPPAFAVDHTVGDSQGWTTGVDYGTWASGKTFQVGDSLSFEYGALHSVNEVTKSNYDSCSSSNAINVHTDGNTKISLTAAGSRYFVCGTPGHCDGGMKLAVSVAASGSGSPPNTPAPSGGSSNTPPSTTKSPPSAPGGNNAAAGGFRGGDAVVIGGLIALGLAVMS